MDEQRNSKVPVEDINNMFACGMSLMTIARFYKVALGEVTPHIYKDQKGDDCHVCGIPIVGARTSCRGCGGPIIPTNLMGRLSKYNLAEIEYTAMVERQNNLCAICGVYMKSTNIDHDHKTGRVRGLLCSKCNVDIGFFSDSPELLAMAAAYLSDGA